MRTTGLILAGGASRRFGEPKPLAAFRGLPMIRWVGDALAARCDELVVAIGAEDDARRFQGILPEARVVRDAQQERGPIEGLLRGFSLARGDLVFVAPSDAPLLRPALYDGLVRVLGAHEAAVPRHDAVDPVRAVYRRGPVLRVLAQNDVASPSALVDRLDTAFLEGDALRAADPGRVSFIDVNCREEMDRALRLAVPSASVADRPRRY